MLASSEVRRRISLILSSVLVTSNLLSLEGLLVSCSSRDSGLVSTPTAGVAGEDSSDSGGEAGAANGGTTAGAEAGGEAGAEVVAGTGGIAGGGESPGIGGAAAGDAGAAALAGQGGEGSGGVVEPPRNPTLTGDIVFSVPSQSFRDVLEVGMTTEITGAEIRYTTDGSIPTTSSVLYTGPLSVTATTELRARPFLSGLAGGQVGTALYVARTFDVTSELPIVVVDGYGEGDPLDRSVYSRAAFLLFEPSGGTASLDELPQVATRAGHHVRGQSSATFPQLPYKVELWDNDDQDTDYAFLGMPAESDWALIAPYFDRSLLRNPIMYDLAREVGLPAPRYRFVEVYVNHEDRPLSEEDYQGIYWFTETIKNQKDRLNLEQLRESDTDPALISGGYIFKFDNEAAEEPKLVCTGSAPLDPTEPEVREESSCWVDLEVVDPEPLNTAQKAWLTGYIQALHDSLHQRPIGDYASHIDVPSFVDYFLLTELSQNVDGYVRSAYYYKDRDEKLKAGPLWDHNLALGVGVKEGGTGEVGPMVTEGFRLERGNVNNWFRILMTDPVFVEEVRARWIALRAGPLSDAALERRIQSLAQEIEGTVSRDYALWPAAGIYSDTWVAGPEAETWSDQLAALRTFMLERAAWLDSAIE